MTEAKRFYVTRGGVCLGALLASFVASVGETEASIKILSATVFFFAVASMLEKSK